MGSSNRRWRVPRRGARCHQLMSDFPTVRSPRWSTRRSTAGRARTTSRCCSPRPRRWRRALLDRLDEADRAVERARQIDGPERAQVVMDFESIGDDVDAALDRLDLREGRDLPEPDDGTVEVEAEQVEPLLQASWSPSHVVVWVGGASAVLGERADLMKALEEFGAPGEVWTDHDPVVLPDGRRAAALSAPMEDVVGWLLGHANDDRVGASTRWLGQLGLFGVSLVARGWMVPLLRHRHRTEGTGTFAVRWHPVLIDDRTLKVFAKAAPAAVFLANPKLDAVSATRSALVAAVHAVCVQAARQIEAPAPPPRLSSATDLAEAYLGRLDGSSFRAPVDLGRSLVRFLDEWAEPVAEPLPKPLVIRLDPPSEDSGWHLQVLGHDPDDVLQPIEQAIASHPKQQIQAGLVDDLMRAERLVPRTDEGRRGATGRGDPHRGRGMGGHVGRQRRPARRGVRDRGPASGPNAQPQPPDLGAGRGVGAECRRARTRAVVGVVRRRRAECRRDRGTGPTISASRSRATATGSGSMRQTWQPRPRH